MIGLLVEPVAVFCFGFGPLFTHYLARGIEQTRA
jgi:hypothetical protein